MTIEKSDIVDQPLMPETGREYLKRVALASMHIATVVEDNPGDILDMLGIGDGPKFTNKSPSATVRGYDFTVRNKPQEVPARLRYVRLRAMQMVGLAPQTDS